MTFMINSVKTFCLFMGIATSPAWLVAADHTKDSVDKVKEMVASKKAIMIDVREKSEWDAGHIQGAKHVPMSLIKSKPESKEVLDQLPTDKVIYLYCAGGKRCLDVATMLEKKHPNLRALKIGYLPLVKEGFAKEEVKKEKDK